MQNYWKVLEVWDCAWINLTKLQNLKYLCLYIHRSRCLDRTLFKLHCKTFSWLKNHSDHYLALSLYPKRLSVSYILLKAHKQILAYYIRLESRSTEQLFSSILLHISPISWYFRTGMFKSILPTKENKLWDF